MVLPVTSFTLKNSLAELDVLAEKVEGFCKAVGASRKIVFQAKLALEEIFVNIVSYGYKDEKEHRICITLSLEGEALVVRVEDDAVPFNPLEAGTPDLECSIEDSPIGGLGLHLTKNVMSEMSYSRCHDKNVLTLKKKINAAAG
ncbi:MAG: ATP-binding protein [Pseudomonadota bacterium]